MPERLHVRISGEVQGVGFRYSTFQQATALGLAGWVRNCIGGEVEAEFEGPHEDLERILDWCWKGPRFARVTHVEPEWEHSEEPKYHTFTLRG